MHGRDGRGASAPSSGSSGCAGGAAGGGARRVATPRSRGRSVGEGGGRRARDGRPRGNFGRGVKECSRPTRNGDTDGSRASSSASECSPCERSGPCRSAGDRPRQPEGWRGEDDDHAQPRRRVRRDGVPRAARRPRPAGEPDDVAGPQPGRDRAVDVRRARPPAAHGARDRRVRGRRGRVLDRPRRRGHGAVEPDRPRARAREGAGSHQGSLRLHLHRHAPVARAPDRERVRRGDRRDRPGADRVPLPARARAAREHARRWCART